MTYLVTGCAGFIGSAVTEKLLQQGSTVLGVDNLNDAYDPRLKAWRLDRIRKHPRFAFHQADITRREDVARVFAEDDLDGVLNLAARAGVRQSLIDPWAYLRTNAEGTLNLLEACRANDVARLVLASTSSLYGAHNRRPFREAADTNRPLSPYAASKKAAESIAATYSHLYGIHTPVLRFFTVYGPAGRPDMSVFRFTRWIAEGEPLILYGDGSQERDFTYVDDIARGAIAALNLKGHEIVNLGGDQPHSVNALIGMIEEKLGNQARIERRPAHAADVPATWADITKARDLLKWEPTTPLSEGVSACVEWYLLNRSWARSLDLGDT